jgi:hypothetical protein
MVFDKDTLKMTYGSSLLFAEDAGDKHREALVRFARILPFVIYNIFRKKNLSSFRLLTAMPSSG